MANNGRDPFAEPVESPSAQRSRDRSRNARPGARVQARMTNRRIAATIALAGGFLLMTGCGSGSDPGPSSATGGGLSSLTGMYAATDVTKAPEPVVGQIALTVMGERILLSAGCNTMSGTATLTDDILVTNGLAMTEMACAPDLMKQDAWLSKLMSGNQTRVVASGSRLTLSWDEGSLVFERTGDVPTPGSDPNAPTAPGGSGDAPMSTPSDAPAPS